MTRKMRNMKTVLIIFSIMFIIMILSIGIADGSSALSNDINNHKWLNLVGRWENRESSFYEIEFRADKVFAEYYYGMKRGFGDFQPSESSVILNYDAASCKRDIGNNCSVTMKFNFENKSLILITNESKMSFNKSRHP
jgi:hypothetical protein